MQTARRLYLYLMSGISLGVLVAGLSLLLTVALEQLGLGVGEAIFGGQAATRDRLTLASALTAVSLPVWLIHWYLAERSVRPQRPSAPEERSSGVRGFYFAAVLTALLASGAVAAHSLIDAAVIALVGGSVSFRTPAGDLGLVLVAGAAWAYHVRVRARDWAQGPITGDGAWLPRAYLYGAALIGLMILLFGVRGLIETAGRLVLDAPFEMGPIDGGSWWIYPLATAIAGIIVGGAMWSAHWWYAATLQTDGGWRGAIERAAKLRLAFYVMVIVVAAATVIAFVGDGARNGIEWALGISAVPGSDRRLGAVLLPLVSSIPFGLAWWAHARWLRLEAAGLGNPDAVDRAHRLDTHSVALVGLAYAGVAIAWLLALIIDVAAGGSRALSGGQLWQQQLAQFVPFALLGAVIWGWKWSAVMHRYATSPLSEATSTVRRAALLVVLAASVLSGIGSLGVIFYRFFGVLFGARLVGDPLSELSLPIGVLLVAVVAAAYHGLALRRDQGLRARATPAEPVEQPPAKLLLTLVGPTQADLATALGALRAHVPEGYRLEEAPSPDTA